MTNSRNSFAILITYCLFQILNTLCLNLLPLKAQPYLWGTLLALLACAAMFGIQKKFTFHNPYDQAHISGPQSLLWSLGGALALFLVQILGLNLEYLLLGQKLTSANTSLLLTIIGKYPYFTLTVVLALPILEEFVFRKVIFGNLSQHISPLGAALLSSLLFALAHGDGHYLTYAGMGLLLCGVYAKTHRLTSSMLSHILMNAAILIMACY